MWDARCGRQICELRAHDSRLRTVSISENGLRICSTDGSVVWPWDEESRACVVTSEEKLRHFIFDARATTWSAVIMTQSATCRSASGEIVVVATFEGACRRYGDVFFTERFDGFCKIVKSYSKIPEHSFPNGKSMLVMSCRELCTLLQIYDCFYSGVVEIGLDCRRVGKRAEK